jgi:hypothetical protein
VVGDFGPDKSVRAGNVPGQIGCTSRFGLQEIGSAIYYDDRSEIGMELLRRDEGGVHERKVWIRGDVALQG